MLRTSTAPPPATAPAAAVVRRRRRRRGAMVVTGCAVTLVAVSLTAVASGPVTVGWVDVIGALGRAGAGVSHGALVWDIRAPRVVVAALVGAGLAVVGAVMQAVFRNPLADPGITGVSSGAAVGAVTVLVTGTTIFGAMSLPLGAFRRAAVATAVLLAAARIRRDGSPLTLVLVGITIGSFGSALTAAIVANAPEDSTVRSVMFWINGDLTARTWQDVFLCAGPILLGTAVLLGRHRGLDALLLGDATAVSMGIHIVRQRLLLLLVSALVTGAAVAVTGVIGFVGLVVPLAVRLVLGPRHALLLPVSLLTGAVLVVAADLAARVLIAPVILQTGTVITLIGSPIFGYLVLSGRGGSEHRS